jgi:hypothetical protein
MKKYAKIINEETKACEVGFGTNSKFYQSIGMVEMEVEEAYNGSWYVKGYAPVKPQELVDEERVAELEKYLNETDWYSIRYAETGKEIPADVLQARQEAREEISKLRGE